MMSQARSTIAIANETTPSRAITPNARHGLIAPSERTEEVAGSRGLARQRRKGIRAATGSGRDVGIDKLRA